MLGKRLLIRISLHPTHTTSCLEKRNLLQGGSLQSRGFRCGFQIRHFVLFVVKPKDLSPSFGDVGECRPRKTLMASSPKSLSLVGFHLNGLIQHFRDNHLRHGRMPTMWNDVGRRGTARSSGDLSSKPKADLFL